MLETYPHCPCAHRRNSLRWDVSIARDTHCGTRRCRRKSLGGGCALCGHLYTEGFWTAKGLDELFREAHANQVEDGHTDHARQLWSPVVQKISDLLCKSSRCSPVWMDVGSGNGGLVMTAASTGSKRWAWMPEAGPSGL